MEEQNLGFVAGIDHSGFDKDAKHIQESVEQIAKKVEQSGMSVDEFAKRMQGVLSSFDRLTQAVDKNTAAQEKAMAAGKNAANEEKQGADKATDAINKTGDAADNLGRKLKNTGDEGSASFDKLSKYAAGFFTLSAAKEFGQKVFDVRSEIQSLQTSFETLVGNKQQAEELFNSIKDFATHTPMQLKDLASAAQTMMSFNIPVEQIMDNLKALGDVSMGDAQKFQSLSLAFSQMSATGKLMGQDLLQMINAGFNPLATMSEKTGKSISQLKDEMSKGAISADMVRQAFIDATSEGGKFYGMLEAKSKTLRGAYSNLQGSIDDMFNSIGEQSEGIMAGAINAATVLAQNYETVGKVIMSLVSTYGTYKAAVMTVTAIQGLQATGIGALTAAEAAHYGWLVLCEKAQKLLNATMLNNPFVLVATLVAGLATSYLLIKKRTDEVAEANKKLNSSFQDTQAHIKSEQANIDTLFDKLRKAKSGTEEYKTVKDQILSQYGKYLNGLDNEIATLKNVEGAYKAITKAAREASLARGRDAALKGVQDTYGETYSSNIEKLQNALNNKVGGKKAADALKVIQTELRKTGTISAQTEKRVRGLLSGTFDYGSSGAWITGLRNNEKYLNDYTKLVDERFRIEEDATNKQEKLNIRNKKAIEEDKKNAQAELDTLSAKEAAGKKGAALRKKIAGYDKELEAYSVKSDSKAASAAAKAAKEEQKQAKEEAAQNARRIQEELRYQEELRKIRQGASDARRDAEIASIQNDAERERAEQDEQHERNLRQIEEQANEMRKAIYEHNKKAWENAHKDSPFENTEAGKAGWMGLQLSEDQQATIDALMQKENAEYLRLVEQRYDAERQATLDFLKEYGDYEQQKLAITQEYEDKIAKASSVTEKASLGLQREKTLKDLEKQQLEDSIDWAGVFNDLSGHTKEYLEGLRDQLQNILSTGNLPIDQMETIQGKIREINDAINEQGGMFSFANEQQREHTRRVQEAADAQNRLNQALKEQTALENQVAELEISIRDSLRSIDPELAGIDFDEGWLDALGLDKQSDLYKKLSEQAVKLAKAEGMLSGAREKTSKTWGGWKKAEDGAKESLEDSIARVAGNIKDWCNNYLGDLPELLNEIGLGSAGEKVSQGLSAVNNVAGAAADYASGNYVGAALKAVSAVKDFGRVLGIGGGNAAEINKELARLSERNEILTQSIDKLTQVMSGKSGASAIKEYEKVADMQKELEGNLKKQMQLQMQYHSAHGSFNSYWGGFSAKEIAEFNKRHGTNWSGSLNDLNADLASLLMGEADMWQKINDTGKGGYGGRVADKIAELAEQAGKAKEQTDALYESLTAGTSRSSVFDDFLGSLYDLADGSEDVMDDIAKNWQQMVNHMVINNLIGAKMQQDLDKWYEELAELNRKRTQEGSTMTDDFYKSELERLQGKYTSFVESGQQQIEQFREMGIIKSVQEEANDAAEATKGYLDTIRSSFEELVSGSEVDIEQWGKNLRNSILQNLVQSRLLDEAFETWAEEWGKKYTDLISQMADGAITQTDYDAQLATLMDEFDKTTDGISEKSKAMWEAFGFSAEEAVEQTESAFKDLHSSFLSTLTDLNADVEAWSKNITKTMVEQLVERNILNAAFDEQMDAWRESFESALEANDTEGLKALRKELEDLRGSLAKQAQEYMNALGYVQEVVNDTTFKDMGGDFRSQLMNLDATAEDWADSVGREMAEKIVDEMVSSTMIQPFLDELQKAFNAAMSVEGATVSSVLTALTPQIEAAKQAFEQAQPVVHDILAQLGITEKQELPFSDLRSTFVNTLMDMEADAETFGKEIGRTLIEQMIDTQLKNQFQDKLDELNNEWAKALQNGDSAAIENIRQQMVQMREDAARAVQPLLDDLKELEYVAEDTPLSGLRSSFLSDLMDMESSTEDFAENINKILTEAFIDKFVLGDAFDEQLENWEKRYGDIMGADISEEERSRQLKALQETITSARDDYAEQARAIQDFMGTSQYGDQQAAVNMADKATYDQFEMYLGIATAQQIALEQGNDVRRQILATLQAMSGITTPGSNIGAEISGKLNITNEYLLTIRNYCATITETFAQKLDYIGNKLARF